MKYGFSRINIKLFTQQVRWLGGKKVEFHPWGRKIKLHKWHAFGQHWNIDWIKIHAYLDYLG
jgi:hypothetical protein